MKAIHTLVYGLSALLAGTLNCVAADVDKILELKPLESTTAVGGNKNVKNAYGFGFKNQSATIPGPVIEVNQGDVLRLHVVNKIPVTEVAPVCFYTPLGPGGSPSGFYPCQTGDEPNYGKGITLHWHGIELDNESDGTPVTQNPLFPGESRTYVFDTPRPGVYWFHPHVDVTDLLFKGAYAMLIVRDTVEKQLLDEKVLPKTVAIALSDISMVADPASPGGWVVPSIARSADCRGDGAQSCRVNEGTTVLVNGKKAGKWDGVVNEQSEYVINLPEGEGLRLDLLNPSPERFFRLRLLANDALPPNGIASPALNPYASTTFHGPIDKMMSEKADDIIPLLRVGGEGGILDNARVEGGVFRCANKSVDIGTIGVLDNQADRAVAGTVADCPANFTAVSLAAANKMLVYATPYNKGEIILTPANRESIVIVPKDKTGTPLTAGNSMTLWTVDYVHNNPARRDKAGYRLIKINIVKNPGKRVGDSAYNLVEGDALRARYGQDAMIQNLFGSTTTPLIQMHDPVVRAAITNEVQCLGYSPHHTDGTTIHVHGSSNPRISLSNRTGIIAGVPTLDYSQGALISTLLPLIGGSLGIDGSPMTHPDMCPAGALSGAECMYKEFPVHNTTRFARIGDVIELKYRNANRGFNPMHPLHMHGFSQQPTKIVKEYFNSSTGVYEGELEVYTYNHREFKDVLSSLPNDTVVFRMELNDRRILPDAIFDKHQVQVNSGQIHKYQQATDGGVGRWMMHCHIDHHGEEGMMSELFVLPKIPRVCQ